MMEDAQLVARFGGLLGNIWSAQERSWLMVRPKRLTDLTSSSGLFRKSVGSLSRWFFQSQIECMGFVGVERHFPSVGPSHDSVKVCREGRVCLLPVYLKDES